MRIGAPDTAAPLPPLTHLNLREKAGVKLSQKRHAHSMLACRVHFFVYLFPAIQFDHNIMTML